jgi:hypothetical protein
VVAFDEQARGLFPSRSEPGIAGKNDPILGFGEPDDVIVGENVRIRDVESQHAKPSRELTDHHIRNELHFL